MLTFKFDTFPVLETERLILREIKLTDVDGVFKVRNEALNIEFTARAPFESKKEAIDLIEKMQGAYNNSTGISWCITIKGNDTMIGSIGFWRFEREHYRAEIGYAILPPFQNQGFLSEAIQPVLAFGFNSLEIHSVEANLHPGNAPSEKILQKNGFVKEGYFKENYYFNGKFDDTLTYGLVKKS